MALYSNAPCDPATCSPNSPLFDLEETRRQTWSSNLLRDLEARAPKPDGTSASTTALQYVAENSGFDVVTFRVDFSESASIKLHLPAEPGSAPINTLQKATQQLTFNCELHPFERRVLAYVVKRGKQRALVRVQYAVTAVVTPSVDAIVEGQERAAKMILQQLQRSNHIFNHVNKLKRLPYRPGAEVARACDEINRYLRDFGDIFVDASFPPQAKSLYDFDAPNKLSEVDSAVYTLCTWDHIHNITDASWTFVSLQRDSASTVAFTSGLPAQDSFLCALTIIAPYCELWLHRWFPTLDASSQFENMVAIPVALCDRGLTWQHVVVDLFFPSFPLGRGLLAPRSVLGELYPALLHKAYAKLKGSYAAVSDISTMKILRELTGLPWVCCFRRTAEGNDTDPSIEQMQLQGAVQATLSYRRPKSDEASLLIVVTCGKLDDHHRAFRLTIPSDEDSRTISVVLHDATGKYLRHQIADNLAEFDRDQGPSALRLSWEQLIELEPAVWSITLGRRHEQRLRQIFLHERDIIKTTAVISVPTLTSITLSSSYLVHFTSETCSEQVDLDVSIASVETDFSLTPLENNDSFQDLSDIHDGVSSKQVVITLNAGEYVVTVSAERPGRSESHSTAEKAVLTPASVDANLQLVFDCLDREGRQELSESDISNFLLQYEHMTPSQRGKGALRSFLHQHGSSSSFGSEERRITLDDFREIYLVQAIQDSHEDLANYSISSKTISSASVRARFQELVWQDLLRLLPSSSSGVDLPAENPRTELKRRDIVDLVCCFHSDTPLLNVVALPEDKSSIDSNNFNI
ncbi:hypothetical protein PC111_g16629 [Phytophthora cactorum]|uniref:Calpain catalytic domain-containing protein n=2 Tax=Phytophthora cactorum TaxID=29920 RepID=A0A8T1BI90_9STRA|nr:hypothetical protein PC111_g16629 [Phytophthora cactorum]KAG2888912.1 hypothetical protein PC114_g18191 [Phytophthora cactorum]KAG2904373.1 hypothetical protein PC115_g15005 [Phytophthora cactorum]KAG3071929.1 hypothetical protein PC122_g15459 [Phytophthora cactorum]KAG3173738.1 hypothetical protein C6341_g9952 [Phytophthora cactorum]